MKPMQLPEPSKCRNYDAIDPLDSRYYDPEIARYLSERSRIAYQARMEAALALTLAEYNVCSTAIAKEIVASSSTISAEDVYLEEQTTQHDIKAVVNCIKAKISPEAQPFVHFGATSYDIVSSASALQLRTAVQELVLPRMRALLGTVLNLSETYADTIQIGRTHGQHAVPITFGFAMASYVSRIGSTMKALEELATTLPGKFAGAVGAYNALSLFIDDPLAFETSLLAKVNLEPAPIATQIVPAEHTIRLFDELAVAAGIMANMAHDMRHLQRSEIAEVQERFEAGQTGSSTMAHKRNPWNFENVISMSKQVSAQMLNANLNISSEHQRDLTDSASARFYGVALASVASMTSRLNRIMSKLEVDTDAMQRNLQLTGGAIAAEPLYLLLEKYGHTEAHEASKTISQAAMAKHQSLYDAADKDVSIKSYWQQFSAAEKGIIQSPETHYSGLAATKARLIARQWRLELEKYKNNAS